MKFFRWIGRGFKIVALGIVSFLKGVVREAKRVRWPGKKAMTENTVTVVVFSAFFALFFSACYTIGHAVLNALGYFG